MASAWLASPTTACQLVTGDWLAMRVEARSARSSMTSVRSRRSASRSGASLNGEDGVFNSRYLQVEVPETGAL